MNRVMQGYVEQADGGIGAKVKLMIVHSEHLDVSTPEVEEEFEVTATDTDNQWVYFTLGILNPFILRFPRHRYIKNFCRWKFRDNVCQYSGSDQACNYTFSDCEAKGNWKRFGGFPSIGLGGVLIK